jgi:hypothetical protein
VGSSRHTYSTHGCPLFALSRISCSRQHVLSAVSSRSGSRQRLLLKPYVVAADVWDHLGFAVSPRSSSRHVSMGPIVTHFKHNKNLTETHHTLRHTHSHTHTHAHTAAVATYLASSSPPPAAVPAAFVLPNAGRAVPVVTAPNATSVHGTRHRLPPITPPPPLPRCARSGRGHLLSRPVPLHHRRDPRERSSRACPPSSGERPALAASPYRRVPSPPVTPPPPLPRRAGSGRGPLLSRPMPPHHHRGPGERPTPTAGSNTVSLAVPVQVSYLNFVNF